jgi:hypothetical protein
MARKTRTKPRGSSPDRVNLTDEERAVALQELGLSQRDLSYSRPTWPYVVGALMVFGSIAAAGRALQ